MTKTILCIGDSTMEEMFYPNGGAPAAHGSTRMYQHRNAETGTKESWTTVTGFGAVNLANTLQAFYGENIDLVNCALSGSYIHRAADNNRWLMNGDVSNTYIDGILDALNATGNTYDLIIMNAGVNEIIDTYKASKRDFVSSLIKFYNSGFIATHTNKPRLMINLIPSSLTGISSTYINAIRDAIREVAEDHDYMMLGMDLAGLPQNDGVHITDSDSGTGKMGRLMARRIPEGIKTHKPKLFIDFRDPIDSRAVVTGSPTFNSDGMVFNAASHAFSFDMDAMGYSMNEGTFKIVWKSPLNGNGGSQPCLMALDDGTVNNVIQLHTLDNYDSGTQKDIMNSYVVRNGSVSGQLGDHGASPSLTTWNTSIFSFKKGERRVRLNGHEANDLSTVIVLPDTKILRLGGSVTNPTADRFNGTIQSITFYDKYISDLSQV